MRSTASGNVYVRIDEIMALIDEGGNRSRKAAILGLWTADNYGSVLTAWSLYRTVERMGYTPVLVDHTEARNTDTKTGEFIRSRCRVTRAYTTSADMTELNDMVDTFIVGSDQNWNHYWLEELKGFAFFLDFAGSDKKMISYASSFGNDDYRGLVEEIDVMKLYLARFDAISMREAGAAKIWSEILRRNVECVIDPVFFTTPEEYLEVAKEHDTEPKNNKRLLEFVLDITRDLKSAGEKAAETVGAEYSLFLGADFIIQDGLQLTWDRNEHDVSEMLSYVSGSDFILTDSFHVTCLAIIFNRPFACIMNTRGRARMETVLRKLGLEEDDGFIEPENSGRTDWSRYFRITDDDWDRVNSNIDAWRKESLKWLEGSLNSSKQELSKIDRDLLLMEAVDIAALGNRNAANAIDRLDIIDRILKEMNDRFAIIDDIIYEHRVKITEAMTRERDRAIIDYFECKLNDGCYIAIRGGGVHTAKLLELLAAMIKRKGISVKYAVDMSSICSFALPQGCTLITPDAFWNEDRDVDAVILSSSKYIDAFRDEADRMNNGRYTILNPYDAFREGEIPPGQNWFDW